MLANIDTILFKDIDEPGLNTREVYERRGGYEMLRKALKMEPGEVLDDHTPFLRKGVPAIDLIDFDFPCWHQTCDDITAVSKESLDLSGETVLEYMTALWRGEA